MVIERDPNSIKILRKIIFYLFETPNSNLPKQKITQLEIN